MGLLSLVHRPVTALFNNDLTAPVSLPLLRRPGARILCTFWHRPGLEQRGRLAHIGVTAPPREDRAPRVRFVCASPHLYATPPDVVPGPTPRGGTRGHFGCHRAGLMRDPASELRRISLLRGW